MNVKELSAQPNYTLEASCAQHPVCGVDEVGRGPWAGPLVAGAAILDPARAPGGIRDSKMLTVKARRIIAEALHERADIGIGIVTVDELDRIGLTAANDLAMIRAIGNLRQTPAFALIDGKRLPVGLPCPARPVIKGDALSLSIAAASIAAKVARDRIMAELACRYPGYGWETNAGYGVEYHRAALAKLGVTPEHRRCFAPISKILHELHAIRN